MGIARADGNGSSTALRVPGLGSLSKRLLEEQGVRTMADLARTDPYDPRFRILGEPFSAWVLYARAVVADEIVTSVDVTPGAIRVTCQKTYDRLASRNAVAGRLGIYDLYVDVEVRERQDAYEVLFRLKPEQMKFGMAQWMEYRNNALQLRSALKVKTATVLSEAPMTEARWPLDAFGEELEERTKSLDGLGLLSRIYLKMLSSGRLNMMVLWDKEAYNRSLTRSFLDEFTPVAAHVLCGGNTPGEMQEQIALNGNDGVVIVDDFEKATPEEKRILLDLLATRRTKITYDNKRAEVNVRARFIFNLWIPDKLDAPILDPDFMGLIDLAIRMPQATDKGALDEAVESGMPSAQEAKGALQATLGSEVMETELPDAMADQLKKFRAPKFLSGFGSRLGNAVEELALGTARQRRSSVVETADLEEGLELVSLANATLTFKQRRGPHTL
jgi:hypothetical protein